jgi:hybrid cluster-associated redox disulfide protein
VPVATFTRDMMIREALLMHEGASGVFVRHGLGCGHCMAAEMETLAAVAVMHEISVDVLLEDLNALGPAAGEDENA